MRRAAPALIALAVLASPAALAQTPPSAPPPVDCRDATHSAVGFWVGDWNVSAAGSATVIATSRIEWIVGGCAIRETYDQTIGPGGKPLDYHGTSYTALDLNDGKWRQYYVDSTGTAALLTGEARDGVLVLNSTRPGPNGTTIPRRMTVSAEPDGSVRQHGEFSADGGRTWQTGYDFIYRRR